MFSVVEKPELYINRSNAEKLASTVRRWGYRDNIDNRHRHTNRMQRWGFKFLGKGYFSAVFQHPRQSNLVIKYGPLDDGWLVFAAWCEAQRSTNNPHLPVIYSIKRYEKHGLYRAVMEKLDCTIGDAMATVGDDPKPLTTWEAVRGRFNYGIESEAPDQYHWGPIKPEAWQEWLTANKLAPIFEKTLERLREFAVKHGLGRDLHGGNAMLRKHEDGTFDLVLTDPFSNGSADRLPAAMAEARQDQALVA
jgi:hypothetical protein